jgi:hypothetical protein
VILIRLVNRSAPASIACHQVVQPTSAGLFGTIADRLAVPGSGVAEPANWPVATSCAEAGSMSTVPEGANGNDVVPFEAQTNVPVPEFR